jgi:DNA-binding MarR family transcriptional regulator
MIESSSNLAYDAGAMASAPRWLEPSEQHTWRAFLEAAQRLLERLDRELVRDVGLPLAYFQILAMLSEAPDRTLRMSDLAERTWSSRSRLSHAVDRLEEKGLARRVGCPSDRRGAFAQLTDAGFAVLEAAAPSHVESVRQHLFDQLSQHQVEALHEISSTIATHLGSDCSAQEGSVSSRPS